MELSQEQIEEFKKQIIKQIESTFSEDKKGPAIEKINSMDNGEFIEFLKKNNLLGSDSNPDQEEAHKISEKNSTPFRLIVEGKIPSYQIDENKQCISVLEINPISKGHTLIIPKNPLTSSQKIPKPVLSLANKISKKIKTVLKPKEILILSNNALGEIILNVLPVYSNENLSSPRKSASKEELETLKNLLEKKPGAKKEKKPVTKKIQEKNIWIPRRIP